MPETALILLAAGSSSRMGKPKQLLHYGGVPLLRHTALQALSSQCRPVIVVLGANSAATRRALDGLDVLIVENPAWEAGMGTSIQAGLQAISPQADISGAILALADQPLLDASIYNGLIHLHTTSGRPVVAASYAGTVGVPVYFSRTAFPALQALQPAQGCKGVILAYGEQALHVPCPAAELDIDTPDDYARAIQASA